MKTRVAAIAALLVLVCIPRFAMWDPGPIGKLTASAKDFPWGHTGDVEGYERLIEYFRGQAPADSMIVPFCYRPLAPAIASALPAVPEVALNLLNLASLLVCVVLLEQIGLLVGLGQRGRWAAGLMFAFSFPAFYYGTIGFVDPVAMMFAALLLLLVLGGKPLALLVPATLLAVLVKETNAAFCLLPLAGAFAGGRARRDALVSAGVLLVAAAGTLMLFRAAAPFPEQDTFWAPSLSAAIDNLFRPRTYLSLLLTIGLPAGFAALAVLTGRARRVLLPQTVRVLATGCLVAATLYVYSLFSAHADGRIIWISYPFLIPLAVTCFENRPPTSRP